MSNISNKNAVFKCSKINKEKFKNSNCLLTISVGQKVHEGKEFEETINLVNSNFKKCTILVDDSLQRHTLKISENLTEEESYIKSIEEGNEWLKRNKEYYCKLTIPYEIKRWDYFLFHNKYKIMNEGIESLFKDDINYKLSFEETIKIFLNRYQKKLINKREFNYKNAFKLSLIYLKEECTIMRIWESYGYQFEVYPNKRNKAMTYTHKYFIEPYNPEMVVAVSIKFKFKKPIEMKEVNIIEKA